MARANSRLPPVAPAPSYDVAAAVDKQISIERIAEDIAAAIVDKRLPPGTWLREQALGRVYSVSRTKVRAALLMLSKDKLIKIIPDKGAFVNRPSVEEAREVFAVRRILESEVVRLFIAGARARDYQVLEQHIKFERAALRQAAVKGAAREKLLDDFHVALAEATGNHTLAELVRELVARTSLVAMLYHSSSAPLCPSDGHTEFLRLCRKGDVDGAVNRMNDHLERVEASLEFGDGSPGRQLDLVSALLV